ncbi:glycosyltransferase family 39 protein [bacterium]|nr:glycosyltransferase family 39 protein [bacterium]
MKTENKNLILFYIGSLFISLLSAYFIWLQTSKYGIGLTPDSTIYLSWGATIYQEGFSFVFHNNDATFPPLYPIVLSIISNIFNIDNLIAARWFNIILLFFFSFFSLILCQKSTKNFVILFVFGLLISFSKPLNLVFSYAWSEPLFIFILLLITFSIEKTSYNRLILCGFLSALAILTRYAGVTIVPAVCLYIFMQKNTLVEKVKKCFCYASIPTLTYIIYLIRNYYFTKTLMGPRTSSITGLISNCDRAFSTVTLWFSGQYFFMTAFFILILGIFVWNYKKELILFISNSQKTVIFSACFSLVYSVFIIISSTTTAYDLINDRLMAPVFLPILLILFLFILFSLHIISIVKKEKTLAYTVLSIFIACTLLSFTNTWKKDISFRKDNGAGGYASAFWQENKLLDYLKKNKLNSSKKIYTNNTYSFFLANTKIIPSNIPLKKYRNSQKTTGITLDNFATKNPDFENSILVYFSNIDRPYNFTLNELQTICEMETIIKTVDGSAFRVGKCKK